MVFAWRVTGPVYTAAMSATHSMRVVVLGSGSSGNATAINDGHTTVLVDCGLSAREISRRMVMAGLEPSTVAAILVTHEHSDHTKGIDVFCRRYAPACEVLATKGTRSGDSMTAFAERTSTLRAGEPLFVGGFEVLAFSTSHDAAEPVGYRVSSGGRSAGIATDTGVLTSEAAEALAQCDLLGIECNHDVDMLERGPYPGFLKRRIRSAMGHLGNECAGDAIERLASDRLVSVVAMHRSETNNTERLAARAVTSALRRLGHGAAVAVAMQKEPTEIRLPAPQDETAC